MTLGVFGYVMKALWLAVDLSRFWVCYVGPVVTLACLAMLCRPFGDLSRAWLCYVGPLVILAMFGYAM